GREFEFDPRGYELRRAGRPLKLEPTPLEILLFLIERRGELVTREEIAQPIWGVHVYVDTDNSINGAIRKIRQVLNDDPTKPQFIQTVSGKGYRFLAEASEPAPKEESGPLVDRQGAGGPNRSDEVPTEAEQVVGASHANEPEASPESAGKSGLQREGRPHGPVSSWARRRWTAVAAVALVVAGGVTMTMLGRLPFRTPRREAKPTVKIRRSVAVLGLQNLSGRPEQEWISTALEETISTELAAGQELRIVPDETVAHLKLDMALPEATSYG